MPNLQDRNGKHGYETFNEKIIKKMNYPDIKKKYPSAYNDFYLYFQGIHELRSTDLLSYAGILVEYEFKPTLEDLFDFFDMRGIFVTIAMPSNLRHFWPFINGHDFEILNLNETPNRRAAHDMAFEKAFEILEKRLNP